MCNVSRLRNITLPQTASDWIRQDPVVEQLAVREFTRPSSSERLKGAACETSCNACADVHVFCLC